MTTNQDLERKHRREKAAEDSLSPEIMAMRQEERSRQARHDASKTAYYSRMNASFVNPNILNTNGSGRGRGRGRGRGGATSAT